MSWTDLFYPDNPKRRNEVVRLCAKFYVLIESNFKHTNDLIDIIHKVLPGQTFEKIYVNRQADIKTNVDVILGRIREIQEYVSVKNEKLKELLEPTLYEKLVATSTSFQTRIAVAKSLSTKGLALVGSVAGVALLGAIYQKRIFETIVSKLGLLRTATLSSLVLSVLVLGVDMIISAIIGAIEKSKLTAAIEELETALREFEPESDAYNRNIDRVAIYLEQHA